MVLKKPGGSINFVQLAIIAIFISLLVIFNLSVKSEQHFSLLAKSFLVGKTYFTEIPESSGDLAYFGGRYYWANSPLPAVLLTPFVLASNYLSTTFYQGYLQIALVIGIFFLIYKITKSLGYLTSNALLLAFAFCFASPLLGVGMWPWSWYFGHVVATLFIVLAFWEFLVRKRYGVIGIFYAAVLLTRPSAVLGVLFYILTSAFLDKGNKREKLKRIFLLLTPIFVAGLIVAFYNYIRFGELLEFGYSYSNLPPFHDRAREYGIYSPMHIPGNLYYMLLGAPLPVFRDNISHVLGFPYLRTNPWGMSLFVTSPYLIKLFFLKKFKTEQKYLFTTAFVVALPIILFFGIGFRQFGYRYALDFLPYVFFSYFIGYRGENPKLSMATQTVIILSAYFNVYLFLAGFFN